MAPTDLENLLDMGFEKAKAELALEKSGTLEQAIEWLDQNADKSVEEITTADTARADDDETNPNVEPAALNPGEVARSLVCNECGKKFRSQAQAEFHASKTEHVDFAESTEEIAPLTEEEKRAKLEELKRKAAERRAGTSAQDKLEQKRNEEIRRKSTKETQDIKEDLKKKEQLKEAAAKKREKQEEIAAKQRIKAKIEADKEERRLKAAKDKAEREGRAPPAEPVVVAPASTSGPVASKPASAYNETRIRFQTPSGSIQKTFPVGTTLFEVASAVSQDSGIEVQSFVQNFPKKVFDSVDFGASLKELGLVPSASLISSKMPGIGEQHKAAATSVNPFEEIKPHISEYTAQEIATLSSRLEKQLGPEYISSRPGPAGQKVHYLAADKCINLANEVFGFNGWSSGIQNIQIDFVDENANNGNISLGLSVIVRVTLRDGTFHEDVGYGQVKNVKDKAAAFEKAKKEGTTDGLKRALRNFGNLLGNCIYDKDYVSKVTKLKVAPTKWDPDNLHRHPDFAPMKKDSVKVSSSTLLEPDLPKREFAVDMETSFVGVEDEFGSDEFDEADLAVTNDGHPDGVSLTNGVKSEHFRNRDNVSLKREPQAAGNGQPASRAMPAPQTPSAGTANTYAQPVKTEPNNPLLPVQRVPQLLAHQQQTNGSATRLQGLPAAHTSHAQNKPVEPNLATTASSASGSTPPLETSSTGEHNPPVGFFTARAAESLQQGSALPSNVPLFNPHLESPSIRKTAGVDHTKTKPVRTESIGAPAAAIPPRTSFVNPQADKTRRVGMPTGVASPLHNRNSYKPPQMKRPADGAAAQAPRSALDDVTSASVNLPNNTGLDSKRQRVGETVSGVGTV